MPGATLELPGNVLVCGAAGGIGGAVAAKLTAAGSNVIGSDRRGAPDDWTGVDWIEADIATQAGRDTIVGRARGEIGGLVLAAGLLDPADWETIDEAAANRLLSVNLIAPFFLIRALLPALPAAASIVIMGSIAGLRGSPTTPFYAASKAALRNLSASLALLLQPRGIRVNTVAPGLIDTPLTEVFNADLARRRGVTVQDIEAERAAAIPMGRPGRPEEVADTCLYLLSRQSAYVTGATIYATGGMLAGAT